MSKPLIQKSKLQIKKQNELTHEEIARQAYEIYEKCGREDGKDLEHWLEAERILRTHQNFLD